MQKIKAKIKDGKIYPAENKHWEWVLKCYEDKNVNIIIKQFKNNRSLAQNSLYWLYMGLISRETGETPERLHKFFKSEFLPIIQYQIFGKVRADLASSSNLDVNEFTEYLNKIEHLTEIQIPNVWVSEYLEVVEKTKE